MRQFINHNLPELSRVQTDSGRFYKTPSGKLYPSVTTILGSLPNHYINEWKEAVGPVEAARVSKAAATRGTELHTNCENYILGKPVNILPYDWNGVAMFNQMKPELDKLTEIHALESGLYSDKYKFAGSVDCIAKISGEMYIVDFKTSRKFKYEQDIHSYKLQVSAYGLAFYNMTGIPVKYGRILITSEHDGIMVYDVNLRDYIPEFIKLRQSIGT